MAYGNGINDTEYEAGAPKKADVLIRSTQHIAAKQEELSEQTKHVAEKLDEAIDLFSKNGQDSSYVIKQSGEIFAQLQSENSALKQELLYLAKQSENIYAGLAEKITELSDQAKTREGALSSLADRINDVSEQTVKGGELYSNIIDKMNELAEQGKRNEKLFAELNEKLEALSESTKKSEKAYGELSDKIVVSDNKSEPSEFAGSQQIIDKINYISEQLRRSEGAHSMLADKFEILSMRVEQFGFESAKGAPAYSRQAAPVAVAVPAATEVKAEIDYDKLAEKVADLISAREVVSPDYIASKVAEQVVIPEIQSANVKVTVDTHDIAKQVADLIGEQNVKSDNMAAQAAAAVSIDEAALADRIAERLGAVNSEPVAAVADVDEEELAERIARKVGGMNRNAVTPVASVSANIDEDELADSIALKVGSLKAEDFEILVDDEGCISISKEIARNLDYNAISNVIADKLREALDLASVNAPDYEEMAERISEKITVAGINEAAIADKAAAALSNYLPEIDTDEIADKVTGAVIDVVSAIPQPTVDSEAICNAISEKLIESQEDHDYDIVIDDEGISKITGLVTEEIEKGTGARFDKVEEQIAKLGELLAKEEEPEVVEDTVAAEETVAEEDYSKLTSIVAAEIEKGTASRFDKVEDDVAKLTELISSIVVEEDYAEENVENVRSGEDYTALSEVVATEIEKGIEGVATRISDIEENVAKITEYLAAEEEVEEEQDGEEEYAEETEEEVADDYATLSEVVAAEIEKGVASRLSGMEENIAKITEYLTAEEEVEEEQYDGEEEYEEEAEEAVEEDYTALSEVIAAEIEKGVSARLTGIEENVAKISEVEESIAKISEYLEKTNEPAQASEDVQTDDDKEYVEIDDCSVLSEVLAAEIEKGVSARLSGIEENVAKISEYLAAAETGEEVRTEEVVAEETAQQQTAEVQDYTALSEVVAAEIEKGVASRLSGMEENIAKVGENITKVEENLANISEHINSEQVRTAKGVVSRIAALEEHIASEQVRTAKGIVLRVATAEENINKALEENLAKVSAAGGKKPGEGYEEVDDLATLSEVVATEIDRGISFRLDSVEENLVRLTELIEGAEVESETAATAEIPQTDYDKISELVAAEIEKSVASRLSSVEENIVKVDESVAKLAVLAESSADIKEDGRIEQVQYDVAQIKEMLSNGVIVASETAAAQAVAPVAEEIPEEEEELVKVSDLVEPEEEELVVEPAPEPVPEAIIVEHASEPVREKETIREVKEYVKEKETLIILPSGNNQPVSEPVSEPVNEPAKQPADTNDNEFEEFEEDEEEEDDDDKDDFSIDVLDMDAFSDDELMPGELSDYADGVDFANMMKFKRSFIARIIQSNDEYKQYYGEVKHALLSYKKVNSNVAWGAERFNKGRETIARMKIRGKTLCLYLALDPNNYKTSVYHHLDVSDNKSVAGTPMMVKIKSNLGVRKAIRLIDEMLAMRNGERKEIPERDYAAMYPYETIEELIEEGLVKDVRKK